MKVAVEIEGKTFLVTPRTGEKYIFRAVLGAIVEAGQAKVLGPQAIYAARALAAGLTGYHFAGPPELSVRLLDSK